MGFLLSCDSVTTTVVYVAELVVSPEVSVVREGSEIQLTAMPMSESGVEVSGALVTWTSGAEEIATVDGDGRVQGVSEGTVVVRAQSGAAADSAQIMVGEPPTIMLSHASLSFQGLQGRGPISRTVTVTNGGTISLPNLNAWIDYEGATGWLEATLERRTAPTTLQVRALPSNVGPGTYRAAVVLEAPLAINSPKRLEVSLDVTRLPEIEVNPGSVSLNAQSPTQAVSVVNGAPGDLSGLSTSISYGGSEGWLSASLDRGSAPATLFLSASPGGLGAGTYQASVTLRSSLEDVEPVTVPVAVTFPSSSMTRPDKVDARDLSSSSIRLTWRDRSINETEFRIQRYSVGSGWAQVATIPSGTTSWTDTGLQPDVSYAYRVRACHPWACSAWSRIDWAKTDDD